MTQRLAIVLLATCCLVLSGYLAASSLIWGDGGEKTWEDATRTYVEEYHQWLSNSPESGWARVEALATGAELSRVERLRSELQGRSDWRYDGGEYDLLLQAGGKALVEASYDLEGNGEKKSVQEIYLLEKTLQGIKVTRVMGGTDSVQ